MRVLKIKNREVAERLTERLLKKRMVVALLKDESYLPKLKGKKVHVAIVSEDNAPSV